jgi:hypothetical protein
VSHPSEFTTHLLSAGVGITTIAHSDDDAATPSPRCSLALDRRCYRASSLGSDVMSVRRDLRGESGSQIPRTVNDPQNLRAIE